MKCKKIIATLMTLVIILTNVIPIAHAAPAYYPACSQSHTSIADALVSVGEKGDYATRAKIAAANNIASYKGSSSQNLKMLALLKAGQLVRVGSASSKPAASASQSSAYYPACSQSHTSIADALVSVGEKGDYATRAKIAAANNIASYEGSSSQNLKMLALLKAGQLVRVGSASSKPAASAGTNPSVSDTKYTCDNYNQCISGKKNATIYVVKQDKAALRSSPYVTGSIITRLAKGQLLSVVKTVKSTRGNWLQIQYTDTSGAVRNAYMYSDDAGAHKRHSYQTYLETPNGTLKMCTVCGHAVATSGGQSASVNLLHVVNQAALGDYASGEATFWGLMARIVVGELPYVSTATELRDLMYDLTHDASVGIIVLDAVALIPLVGSLKHIDELTALKYADDVPSAAKYTDEIEQVIKNFSFENLSVDEIKMLAKHFSLPEDLFEKHIRGFKNCDNYIEGGHSLDALKRAVKEKGGSYSVVKRHPSIPGIYECEYKMSPSKKYAKTNKTLYDPAVISHNQFEKWAREALENPHSMRDVGDGRFELIGRASNGLEFVAATKNGEYVTVYPRIPN